MRKLRTLLTRIAAKRKSRRARRFVEDVFGRGVKAPLTLIDIGASGELPEPWKGLGHYLSVTGFEPDASAFRELVERAKLTPEEGRRMFLQVALSDRAGEADFYVTRKQACSSMLVPNRKTLDQFPNARRFDVMSTVRVKTKTLDAALEEASVQGADFIKLDTQGSELAILWGAAETLKNNILGVEVEVEFAQLYKDQPLFGDVDGYLRQMGFVFVDFIALSWWRREAAGKGKGQLIDADALYMKDIRLVPGDKTMFPKAAAICVLYERFDYALALLREAQSRGLIEEQEHHRLLTALGR